MDYKAVSDWVFNNNSNKEQSTYDKQKELYDEIVEKTGINITTCGNCSDIVLHRVTETELTCASCGLTSEPCDFPDLYI